MLQAESCLATYSRISNSWGLHSQGPQPGRARARPAEIERLSETGRYRSRPAVTCSGQPLPVQTGYPYSSTRNVANAGPSTIAKTPRAQASDVTFPVATSPKTTPPTK